MKVSWYGLECYAAAINLDCQVVITAMDDRGHSELIERLALPPECSFDGLDDVLDDHGYIVVRFAFGSTTPTLVGR